MRINIAWLSVLFTARLLHNETSKPKRKTSRVLVLPFPIAQHVVHSSARLSCSIKEHSRVLTHIRRLFLTEMSQMIFSSAILAILCALASTQDDSPPYQYKGCSDEVGNYVLNVVNKKCGTWNADSFKKYIDCKTDKGANAQDAVKDCGPEILKNDNPDVFAAVCPTGNTDNDIFNQYHINCCLINHALEFSEKTWKESKEIDQQCFSA